MCINTKLFLTILPFICIPHFLFSYGNSSPCGLEGHASPLTIPLGRDDHCIAFVLFLSLRFKLHQLSIHIEQEIFSDDGLFSQSILCPFTERGNERLWLLPLGPYRLFGVLISISNASTVLLTPGRSTASVSRITAGLRTEGRWQCIKQPR